MRRALWLPLAALAAAVTPSCGSDPATAIVVALSSEADVPTEIDEISIEVKRNGKVVFAYPYKLERVGGVARLPGTLALTLHPEEDASESIKITVRANQVKEQVVLRTATMSFDEGKQKLLRIALRYSCFDFPKACGDGQTCIGGECASDFVNVKTLPDYSTPRVFPTVSEGGCFDDRDSACAAGRYALPDLEAFAKNSCTQDAALVPGFKAGSLNVFAVWAEQSDKGHPIPLDFDAAEGWSFAKNSSTAFSLAPGLCAQVKSGQISKVALSFACPTKAPGLPICEPDKAPDKAPTLASSQCTLCAYAPKECDAPFKAAQAALSSKPLLECALACPFDGRYDTEDECSASRNCFFGCIAPYLECQKSGSCGSFEAMDSWQSCLAGLPAIADRCSPECSAENVATCK